ncbi:MAG: hypothetical protein K9L57_07405 [Spirochaetaceae bacterium]|nr:hypothetical protein [Spirochaetaceae bacterium]
MKTEKLMKKIEALEKEIEQGHERTRALKNKLGSSYAEDGGDTSSAHKALSKHREELADKIEALSALENTLAETSKKEREEIQAEIEAEGEKRREQAQDGVEKALAAINKSLPNFMADEAGGATAQIRQTLEGAVNTAVSKWEREQLKERQPAEYKIARRTPAGRCLFESGGGSWYYRAFRFYGKNNNGNLIEGEPHRHLRDSDKEDGETLYPGEGEAV